MQLLLHYSLSITTWRLYHSQRRTPSASVSAAFIQWWWWWWWWWRPRSNRPFDLHSSRLSRSYWTDLEAARSHGVACITADLQATRWLGAPTLSDAMEQILSHTTMSASSSCVLVIIVIVLELFNKFQTVVIVICWTRKGPYALRRLLYLLLFLLHGDATVFEKCLKVKALLIRNGQLRNLAYTFVTSFPTDLPS